MLTSAAEQHRVPKDKDKGQPQPCPTNPEAQKSSTSPFSILVTGSIVNSTAVKRRRSIEDGDLLNHDAKRPKYGQRARQSRSKPRHYKQDFIDNWL
ncbi:MAG: hypothetical protein Q9187_008956, partial [Circinaria calcarea]